MNTMQEVQSFLQDRLAEVDSEIIRLRRALDALDESPSPKETSAHKPSQPSPNEPSPSRPSRRPRTTRRYSDDQIIGAIAKLEPEVGPVPAAQVRDALPGMSSHTLSMRFRKLMDAGRIERTGERRSSAYTVIT